MLYHASMDDKVKSMFTNTDCIPMVNIFTKKNPISKKKTPTNKQEKMLIL